MCALMQVAMIAASCTPPAPELVGGSGLNNINNSRYVPGPWWVSAKYAVKLWGIWRILN